MSEPKEKTILSKVFYTPVQDPEDVRCIEIESNQDLEIINAFVQRIIKKKLKKPLDSEPDFSEKILLEVMNKGLYVVSEEAKELFEGLSKYMYGRAREQGKYWCLIITEEYFFVYHFTPAKAISFEGDSIREFIKYLDDTNLLKFIFKLKSERIPNFFEELSDEDLTELTSKAPSVYGIFDKSGTKGMKKLTGVEPEYEFKGELRVRIKRTEKTDIVVETFLEDLENINSNITFNFQRGVATIKVENAPITELVVDGIKYDAKTGLKRIEYEKLSIGEFIEMYNFHKNSEKIKELKDYIIIGGERVNKPENNLEGKEETIFILGDYVNDSESLINDVSESIRNNFNVAFVELSGFSENYEMINIGHFTIFAKFKKDEKIKKIEETFKGMIQSVRGNLTLEATLHYIGLLVLTDFLKSKGFKEKLYQIGKKALNDYYLNMPERNIELKEIDKIGIEFKAGIRKELINGEEKEVGFFDPSPEELAKKLVKKFKSKRNDTAIFFVGINEDTRDFSPIPLNRIRNEFHEDLRRHISSEEPNINILLSETIPISREEGIIVLVVQRWVYILM